jgi:hypothetical protein
MVGSSARGGSSLTPLGGAMESNFNLTNKKSDVEAKYAFAAELRQRGFDTVVISGSPSDIIATRGDEKFYFEIKFTNQASQYFGAATLTEWEAALEHEARFWFIVAFKRDEGWIFHEYTPAEFMCFSSIPPFKIFFHIGVDHCKDNGSLGNTRRVRLTRDRVQAMLRLFRQFRNSEVAKTEALSE